MKENTANLKERVEQIFIELRDLQKEVQEKIEEMDRQTFMDNASDLAKPLLEKYKNKKSRHIFKTCWKIWRKIFRFSTRSNSRFRFRACRCPWTAEGDRFQPYQVNLLVDNSDQNSPPVIVEGYPTYRNIFGSIERIVDRAGVWRTDFSKIKAGSLLKALGGYLVINLLDAIQEPGVWQALKRALKSEQLEIQTYDPFYLFTTSGLKPEAIDLDIKVVVIGDAYLYHLLLNYDPDMKKVFKVRADFDTAMDKNDESIGQISRFIRMKTKEEELKPFDRTAVALLVEQAVRMTGRQEKITTSFPQLTDLVREADYVAGEEKKAMVTAEPCAKGD
jgi:predicted ATP-dependent protease